MEQKEFKLDLKDILHDINYVKSGDFINNDNEKHYSPFVVNKCLWGVMDSLFFVQELNTFGKLTKQEHYKYLVHALPKKKRFAKWIKEEKDPLVATIQEYYNGCSESKAKEIKKMLRPADIEFIISYLDKGGSDKKVSAKKQRK